MIWCVDDDAAIREIEVYTLKQTSFEAQGFSDGLSVLEALRPGSTITLPDLILLDIMLPGKDGIEVLKSIRNDSRTKDIPIIMATAKGTEMDKIQGLDTGADDYLVKPFGMMEMVSHIKAVLRRCRPLSDSGALCVGRILLDEKQHSVQVSGSEVSLTLKEYEILKLFLQNVDVVFSREKLLSKVWGIDYMGETRTVDMHIKTLRQKLGSEGSRIVTVIGVGYKLEGKT